MIEVTLHFVPPKTTSQQKRLVMVGGKPRFFKNKQGQEAEGDYMSLLAPHVPKSPMVGPTSLKVIVTWPYLKSDLSTKAKANRTDSILHTSKPDLDNWLKQFTDCLVKLRFLETDAQIVCLSAWKTRGYSPGVYFKLQVMQTGEQK